MWNRTFWTDALERAIRTVAQVVLSLVTVDGATPALNVNWLGVLYASLVAGGLSILMSIVASGKGQKDSASLVSPPVPAIDEQAVVTRKGKY